MQASLEILDKFLKSRFLIPPLFVNLKWPKGRPGNQKILFYSFVPRASIKK